MSKFAGVAIGIASSGRTVDLRWAMSLATLGLPVGMSVAWIVKVSNDRAKNREEIAEAALSINAPYMLFIDDDTVLPNFGLQHLFYQLAQNPDVMICGGIYCTKEEIPSPVVFKEIGGGPFWEWKIGDVFECKGIGAGAMLIRTEVFKHLEKPWFLEPHEIPIDKITSINGIDVPLLLETGNDDLYFCNKVVEAGFKVLAHGGVLPLHLDQEGKMYALPENSYPYKAAV